MGLGKHFASLLAVGAVGLAGASAQTTGRTDLEVLCYSGNQNVLGSAFRAGQQPGASEGADVLDSTLAGNLPDPDFAPQLFTLSTAPFGVPLSVDARPQASESVFAMNLRAVDQTNPQGVLPATAPQLQFNVADSDANRVYLLRVSVSGQHTQNGQPYTLVTNVTPTSVIQFPPLKPLANGTAVGSVELSTRFVRTSDSAQVGYLPYFITYGGPRTRNNPRGKIYQSPAKVIRWDIQPGTLTSFEVYNPAVPAQGWVTHLSNTYPLTQYVFDKVPGETPTGFVCPNSTYYTWPAVFGVSASEFNNLQFRITRTKLPGF